MYAIRSYYEELRDRQDRHVADFELGLVLGGGGAGRSGQKRGDGEERGGEAHVCYSNMWARQRAQVM